jgi:hypothetical protein
MAGPPWPSTPGKRSGVRTWVEPAKPGGGGAVWIDQPRISLAHSIQATLAAPLSPQRAGGAGGGVSDTGLCTGAGAAAAGRGGGSEI